MAEAELDAYTAGFEAAISHLRRTLQAWVDAKDGHRSCSCPACRFLRELAGDHGGWTSLVRDGQLTADAVHGHAAGYRAGIAMLQGPIRQWVEMRGKHSKCMCPSCRELRLIAAKQYAHPCII